MEKPIKPVGEGPEQYGLNEDGLFLRKRYGRHSVWDPARRWVSSEEYRRVRDACERCPDKAYTLCTFLDLSRGHWNPELAVGMLEEMLAGESSEWPKPSRNSFSAMAKQDSRRLIRWIESGLLEESQLTFAAESLGEHGDEETVPTLLGLLDHEHAVVREGALIGLSYHLKASMKERLEHIVANDSSRGVRETARDLLEELAEE